MTTAGEIRAELLALSESLSATLEALKDSGATGLEPASEALVATRSESKQTIVVEPIAPSFFSALKSPAAVESPLAVEVQHPPPAPAASIGIAEGAPLYGPSGDAAHARLQVLGNEVRACTLCRLHEKRKQAVFARGRGTSGLCFVGEGPGADEDAQGFPFVGKAGQLLDRMIGAMGFDREEVYVCNVVKCRPPDNRKPEIDEIAACSPYLHEQIELIRPELIVALGASAVQGLLGTTEGITRMRGRWKLYRGKIPVMPTFHPAYLLRQPDAKRNVWEDLQAVLERMGRPVPPSRRG